MIQINSYTKVSLWEFFIRRLNARYMIANHPIDHGATSIIRREIDLWETLNPSSTNSTWLDVVYVPKFLYEQYQYEQSELRKEDPYFPAIERVKVAPTDETTFSFETRTRLSPIN